MRLALAAYHAGQGNVDEWRRTGAGIAFPETRAYVAQVLELSRLYKRVYGDELSRT
jgi:soluble lytic murein transglycosylase-like protein